VFLGAALRLKLFDHRTLQEAHDLIAASYRYHVRGVARVPFKDDTETVQRYLKENWLLYLHDEVASLCNDPRVAKAIVLAAVRANMPDGYDAEDELQRMLKDRYAFIPL